MACKNISCLCNHLIISEAVAFSDGVLTINLPAGSYENREKYCIIVAQDIPEDTTIAATVGITIGTSDTVYPLVNPNCTNINACQIKSRTKYATRVFTNIQTGVFKLLESVNCFSCGCNNGAAPALPIQEAETATTGGEG